MPRSFQHACRSGSMGAWTANGYAYSETSWRPPGGSSAAATSPVRCDGRPHALVGCCSSARRKTSRGTSLPISMTRPGSPASPGCHRPWCAGRHPRVLRHTWRSVSIASRPPRGARRCSSSHRKPHRSSCSSASPTRDASARRSSRSTTATTSSTTWSTTAWSCPTRVSSYPRAASQGSQVSTSRRCNISSASPQASPPVDCRRAIDCRDYSNGSVVLHHVGDRVPTSARTH
ncbi:MAG: hypothetical protein QOI54_1302 [Actinomycetota bacterium]|nr:hypothetical protein [Actinomycetota bacterium]